MKIKKLTCFILSICLMTAVAGCGNQNNEKQDTTTKSDDQITAIHAGETDVYLDEARYYAYTAQATYETYYLAEGKEINWNSEMSSGVTMKKGVKSLVLDDICKRECMYALAEEYNVTLSENDEANIDYAVDCFYTQTNEKLQKKINISKVRLKKIFVKKQIAQRVEEIMTASGKTSPEEMYEKWKKGNTVTAEEQWKNIDFKEPIFTLKNIRETLGSDQS